LLDIQTSNSVVANRVREIIRKKGLKQAALAERAGFSAQEFSDMLNGRRLMRAIDIASIINALKDVGVDANYLFTVDSGKVHEVGERDIQQKAIPSAK
jgi:transcriptional regulator with XRE-family HTH domain